MLFSAALIGSGVGLGLGAAYMMGGLGQVAIDNSRAAQVAEVPMGLADSVAPGAGGPVVLRAANLSGVAVGEPMTKRLKDKPAKRGYSSELECLTDAVYYEARGETFQGQAAVAQVVMNRVKHPAFPKTVCGVVFQGSYRRTGCQFSFACDGSMRSRREAAAWTRARKIAARTLSGVALADVGSATHFHTTGVSPAWGPQMRRVGQVGLHVFYRFNPRRKPGQPLMANPGETMLASNVQQQPTEGPVDIRLTSAVLETAPPTVEPAQPATDAAQPPKAADAPPAGLSKADGAEAKATQASALTAS